LNTATKSPRSSTEKLTAAGRAAARVRDKLRDNYRANGLITNAEYEVAKDALNLIKRQLRNLEKAA
jgi:transcription elongation GreA/GreB family factor